MGGHQRAGIDLPHETTLGTVKLLHITLDATGASVSNDDFSGLRIFKLDTLGEGPTEITANLTSPSAIQALLQNDVVSDHTVNSPLFLGFMLHNLPVPVSDLGDGSVAKIHVDTTAFAAASIPDPETWALFATGLVFLSSITRQRVRNSRD